jgi:uncharacterized protein YecE (DUF72 family)
MSISDQLEDLFGELPADAPPVRPHRPHRPVRPMGPDPELVGVSRRLPRNLHLGTSSLSFPGWAGIVYAEQYATSMLARHGLAAYARHPLLNALNIDSTFYKPQTADQFAHYASDVPAEFRFIVKAYSGLTTAPDSARALRTGMTAVFLDSDFAAGSVVAPLVAGLGDRLGAVLFQFSPLGLRYTRQPATFVARLREFLGALPRGPVYAVELRDREILGPEYETALASAGAVHCASVHSRMPPVDSQVAEGGDGPMIIRWMLRPGDDYERAGARFAPFSRILEPDELSRSRIVAMAKRGLSSGRDVYVTAANNAEGSAPLTLFELAKAVAIE